MKRTYGYGIIDRNGNAWWDEACVCKDREPLLEVVENLNEEWRSIKAGDCGCDEKDKRK